MTTINAESLLKMIAWMPGGFAIGELYPAIDFRAASGRVLTSQTNWRTIWPANSLYTFSTTPENMYVSSSSAADIGRIIFVAGLDGEFGRISGFGITNGQNQSIVTSLPGAGIPLEFFRVNLALDVTLALNKATATGNMYIAALTTPVGGVPPVADTRAIISQGESRSSAIVYTTPAGYMFCPQFILSQDGSQQIQVRITSSPMTFSGSTLLYAPTSVIPVAVTIPGVTRTEFTPPAPIIAQQTDITLDVLGTSPVSGTCLCIMSGTLIDYRYIKNLRLGGESPFLP
jgi:hypothetical protein